MNNFDIPVLFLTFNRLDTTKQVFEVICKVAPSRLYIASDGPRDNREGEKEKIEAVRDYILGSINWDCEVKKLFRDKNLGCGKAPAEAITWFFENEEMGIILEDDCLPSITFFPYCKELLEEYKDDEQIYHIAGNNPLTEIKTPYSYYFARIQHCWGWATWRRAWNQFNYSIVDLDNFIIKKKIDNIFTRSADKNYWLDIFKEMEKYEKDDIWDYQWTYTIFNNNGICINPSKNLITNIGFGIDATHTSTNDTGIIYQERFEINEINHPTQIQIDNRLVNKINKIKFNITTFSYYKKIIKKFLVKHRLLIK
jgi:hypothetical protein